MADTTDQWTVVMSLQTCEERPAMADIYAKSTEAEEDVRSGKIISGATDMLVGLRVKHSV